MFSFIPTTLEDNSAIFYGTDNATWRTWYKPPGCKLVQFTLIGGGGGGGTVTSVAVTVPTALSVSGSPITTSGTIAISGAGTSSQYIKGDGTLGTYGGGGGGSNYSTTSVTQASGGSGVVILSVPTANYTGTTTGSPTVTTSGSNTIIKWTSGSGTYTA